MLNMNEAGRKDRIIFFILGCVSVSIGYLMGCANILDNTSIAQSGIKVFDNVQVNGMLDVQGTVLPP